VRGAGIPARPGIRVFLTAAPERIGGAVFPEGPDGIPLTKRKAAGERKAGVAENPGEGRENGNPDGHLTKMPEL